MAEPWAPKPSPVSDRRDELTREVEAVGFWWHTIDLGGGVVTPGVKGGGGDYMERELAALQLPDLRDRTVLDIGAWDGYYAFAAERLGAARVVALDHYVWEQERFGSGRGFELARDALGSRVEKCHRDFSHDHLSDLGTFDVVLFLGVLYHLEDPLRGLRRLRALTAGTAVIESDAIMLSDREDSALVEFFPGAERLDDPTNWWAPNLAALHGLCHAAGFSEVRTIQGPPPPKRGRAKTVRYRAILHATV